MAATPRDRWRVFDQGLVQALVRDNGILQMEPAIYARKSTDDNDRTTSSRIAAGRRAICFLA